MLKIGIILGSVREGRNGLAVAQWTTQKAKEFTQGQDVEFEMVDLLDYHLPFLGTKATAEQGEAIKNWSEKMASFDGYIFVVAEYNHGVSGTFKNALDFLNPEVKDKALAFVGYGGLGAARSIESLRMIAGQLAMATTQTNVNMSLMTDFENMSIFKPASYHDGELKTLLGQLINWSTALKTIR
ncbi:NADPH-dependent FMN reductase [Lactococcus fujiensis]|uniref:Reductase n=1 Tax=Lactococcus fujiensis JCM 16395 TaxID=1291764 RepID=A0A2A5RJ10_9LACT|nr:NAD(P)H-dependent oxidoreductase [Lactococcus fujiensis]PCR99072.1 reductase [Lactococcus fujiensis JCM 16395]